jgi:hypothetical protein
MRKAILITTLLLALGGVAFFCALRMRDTHKPAAENVIRVDIAPRDKEAPVKKFCSTCHTLPPPDCEPRRLWPKKVEEMFDYAQGGRPWPETQIPPIEDAIDYFMSRAPVEFEMPGDAFGSPPSPLAFEPHRVKLAGLPGPVSISCVRFVRLRDDGPARLLISDMRHGIVALWTPSESDHEARVIAEIPHPSRTCVVDLDRDGIRDILVANLGVFLNVDTDRGSVVWLRGREDGEFEMFPLAEGLSRVNEIQPGDFDGDGDLDLIVAVFGNFTTGMIAYLENYTTDYSQPDFEPFVIDGHTGTSDVPSVDLDGDARPDFIALQAQEHERIVAFLNTGRANFRWETIYAAPHPRWGSTGIELIDMDGDEDLDVLWNHGDAFQLPPIPRPYHGISWLENKGTFPFTYHRLTHLPGAQTAQTTDLDGDGDRDIVCTSFIPSLDPDWPNTQMLETVIWLEQTAPGQYQRYAIEHRTPFHPCMDLGDWDHDGDIDIVAGNFLAFERETGLENYCLTIYENLRIP